MPYQHKSHGYIFISFSFLMLTAHTCMDSLTTHGQMTTTLCPSQHLHQPPRLIINVGLTVNPSQTPGYYDKAL